MSRVAAFQRFLASAEDEGREAGRRVEAADGPAGRLAAAGGSSADASYGRAARGASSGSGPSAAVGGIRTG
eukprot:253043-Alexandrium_andersonii.AAC.1